MTSCTQMSLQSMISQKEEKILDLEHEKTQLQQDVDSLRHAMRALQLEVSTGRRAWDGDTMMSPASVHSTRQGSFNDWLARRGMFESKDRSFLKALVRGMRSIQTHDHSSDMWKQRHGENISSLSQSAETIRFDIIDALKHADKNDQAVVKSIVCQLDNSQNLEKMFRDLETYPPLPKSSPPRNDDSDSGTEVNDFGFAVSSRASIV